MDKNNQLDHSHDDCPYCQDAAAAETEAVEHSHDDCPYCARLAHRQEEGHADDCPYCQSYEDRQPEHDETNCPYCQSINERQDSEPTVGPGPMTDNPTTTDSENFAGQDLNAPDMPKPDPSKEAPIGLGTSMDSPTNNNANHNQDINQGVSNETQSPKENLQLDHSKEALQEIAQEIESDAKTSPEVGDTQKADSIDDTDLASGTEMQGNTSRPTGYSQNNIPQDMGLPEYPEASDDSESEEEFPDLGSVLQEGLDSNAEDIKREKIVQMISQALIGFKGSKDVLERAQTQAPQLYQSSLAMLKAMIEMARMLGFGQNQLQANDTNPMDAQNEWSDPFPRHPDHGQKPTGPVAPAEVNTKDTKDAESTIGQSIGKLPTSATTPHVAAEPLLPGAINAKGQMKYVDPSTGKESFIDMKEGRVKSPTGKPVKP